MRFYLAFYIARLAAWVIRRVARDRGTNLPGEIALRIDPDFVSHIKGVDPSKAVFITGTNGKSTSTNLIHHILSHSGCSVCSNLKGANLLAGVATALMEDCSLSGRLKKDYIVMETDERYLRFIRRQLPAKYLCVTNIQKDQAQRNGEPSFIRNKIAQVLDGSVTLFVNHDEPNAYSLRDLAGRTVSYGADENSCSFRKDDDFFAVSVPCPCCHNPVEFQAYNIDNIGPFRCPVCGFGEGEADYVARDVDFEGKRFSVDGHDYAFHFNTAYFLYCYVLAVGVATELGIPREKIAAALEQFDDIRGLVETRELAGKQLHYIKIKQENSETLQSALNLTATDPHEKDLLIYHTEFIDLFPPYANSFYFYDCDFRGVLRSGVGKWVCMCQTLSRAIATRFLYDGYDEKHMILLPDSREETIRSVMESMHTEDAYLIAELTYWKTWGGGNL